MNEPALSGPAARRQRRVYGALFPWGGRWSVAAALLVACLPLSGCTLVTYLGTDTNGEERGKLIYIGGAGTLGHVGTIDVPDGMRKAGYDGATEVFGWQSLIGDALRDQLDRWRNAGQARRLAERISEYLDEYPESPVDIIALSAGTGIATWALESLPPDMRVRNVVFLSSSLSERYDMTEALEHVSGKLYCFFAPGDQVLKIGVPITGSVDNKWEGASVAGLHGFKPPGKFGGVPEIYRRKLRNMPYKDVYRRYGYDGNHTDNTTVKFIENVVAPLIMRPAEPVPPPHHQRTPHPPDQPSLEPAELPPLEPAADSAPPVERQQP